MARYSLRVHQVYRGLLIDNGLHVDPGYCGHIWIPVHNFTTQPRLLPQGQEFISVEFNRTTPLPSYIGTVQSEDELVSLGIRNELRGSQDRPIKVFYKTWERYLNRAEEFTPRKFWDSFPGEEHKSAMLRTEERIESVRIDLTTSITALRTSLDREISSFRRLGILAAFGLVVGLLAIALPILYAEYGKSREVEAQHGADIRELREQVQAHSKRLDALPGPQPAPVSGQAVVQPPPKKGR